MNERYPFESLTTPDAMVELAEFVNNSDLPAERIDRGVYADEFSLTRYSRIYEIGPYKYVKIQEEKKG